MDIILASASPRRYQLLKQIGLDFSVKVSNIEEDNLNITDPEKVVQELALQKAQAVARTLKNGLVIGADTIVVKDRQLLGKPENKNDVINMLHFLSGKKHKVMTGIALVNAADSNNYLTDVEITKVKFRTLTEKEIYAYEMSGEPYDKAGSYAIQGRGALFVEGLEGCYFNVVGLPLVLLAKMLKRFGVEVLNGVN